MKRSTFIFMLAIFLMAGFSLSAQKIIVGQVTDKEGEPLIGANIVVAGTAIGTVSDLDGNYSLEVSQEAASLVFSYTGFQNLEVPIGDRERIDVQLEMSATGLEEVVVVGYGAVKKSDLTGAVQSVTTKELEQIPPVSSFDQVLQGNVAGVQVQQTEGAPGGNVNILIRGVSSITGGNQPLYVIDGFPYTPGGNSSATGYNNDTYSTDGLAGAGLTNKANPLTFINQSDIESIEVLKDASATAIYGSRGANGVVIITTKRGNEGRGRVDLDVSFGLQELSKKIELMNGPQFAAFTREGRNNAWELQGGDPEDPNEVRPGAFQFFDEFRNPESVETVTDWQDEVFRTAPVSNYQLSFSGGSKNIRYMISGGYFDQEGIIPGSDFRRFTGRANVDGTISERFSVGLSFTAYRSEGNYARTDGHLGRRGLITAMLANPPTAPILDEDGEYYTELGTIGVPVENPFRIIEEFTDFRKQSGLLINTYLDWEIADGLKFRTTLGANNDQSVVRLWKSSQIGMWGGRNTPATAASQTSATFDWLNENTLTYTRSFNRHNLSALAGFTAQRSSIDFISVAATEFGNDYVPYVSAGIVNAGTHTLNEWALLSFVGRLNYNFAGKYYFTTTWRTDGSSRFGPQNRWATFPSVAVAYRLSEEGFMQSVGFITNLKLRASYGLSGNNQIGNYAHIALLSNQNYVINGAQTTGLAPSRLENSELTWEESRQLNLGIDLGLFRDRLSLSVDVFRDTKESMLFDVQLPTMTGFRSAIQNLGKVRNEGIELALTSVNLDGTFSWLTTLNLTAIRNEVLELNTEGEAIFGGGTGNVTITQVGYPISSFYGRQLIGIFQSQAEIDASPFQSNNTRPGDAQYADVDGDGRISGNDRTIIGNPWPNFTFGFNNSFSYKNFGLDVQLIGSYGNDIYAAFAQINMNSAGVQNQLVEVADGRWKSPEEPGNGRIPRAVRNGSNGNWLPSSRFVFDGSFLRINNVRLTYSLPRAALEGMGLGLRELTFYGSIRNLYTFSDYPGYNPEGSTGGNDLTTMGFDYGTYPLPRSYFLGLRVSF